MCPCDHDIVSVCAGVQAAVEMNQVVIRQLSANVDALAEAMTSFSDRYFRDTLHADATTRR